MHIGKGQTRKKEENQNQEGREDDAIITSLVILMMRVLRLRNKRLPSHMRTGVKSREWLTARGGYYK